MKHIAVVALLAAQLIALPASAVVDEYEDSESHPLRIAAYLLHPIGFAAEWLIFRPFHYLTSRSGPVFGHQPHRSAQ